MKKLGIFYHPVGDSARRLAEEVQRRASADGVATWMSSPWDKDAVVQNLPDSDLLLCLGGDGTVLSAARSVQPHGVPILGVNLGRLGFLCELAPNETIERLPEILLGRYRIEELSMLRAELPALQATPALELHALNDVTIARASVLRPIYLTLEVDGVRVAKVRADGMVIATATGSTGYSLSAGGPVLPPSSREIVVTAIAPHLSRMRPLVLPGGSMLSVTAEFDHEAVISLDGQVNRPLHSGETVQIQQSPYRARLARLGSTSHFYSRLNHYLDSAIQD